MNKILIVVPSFDNGGTISTLRNTLAYIDKSQCSIDIFPITNSGPNYSELSKYASILGTNIENNSQSHTNRIKVLIFLIVKRIKKALCSIGIDISAILFKQVAIALQKKKYDQIIAFQEGQPTRLVGLMKCEHKVAWVHCDYSQLPSSVIKSSKREKLYNTFDKIICVSEYTKNQFINVMPECKNKVFSVHNLMNAKVIVEKGSETIDDIIFNSYNTIKFVSLGRLAAVKRFSEVPIIASRLRQKGLSFCWFIIGGDASDKENIDINIAKYNVEQYVKLLGNKNNPYPYIKQSDLLICTSISEACPNVINEAKILGVPVVSTNFGSSTEMLIDGEEGYITSIDRVDQVILKIFDDNNLYKYFKQNLSTYKYDNSHILNKIEELTLLRFLREEIN